MADPKVSGGTASEPNVQASSGGGFARRSSGLVRDFSQLDQWMYNTLAINVVVAGALIFGLITFIYPRANLALAFIIAGVFCVFEAIFYACLTAIMPRSGGDYVFQSRVFGGGVATVFAFTTTALVQILYYALSGAILATIILAPFFEILGHIYDTTWMIEFGEWVVTKWGIFACGVFVALLAGFINARGLRFLARVQRYTFWTGLVLLVFFIIVLALTPHSDFVSNINGFFEQHYGIHDVYDKTINATEKVDTSFSLEQTLFAAVMAGFLLIYPSWGVQQAGETKRANSVRGNLRAMIGAEVFSVVALVVIGLLLQSHVGRDFMYSSGTLFNEGAANNPLPVPPFLGFFFAIAGNSAIFFWLAFVMFVCWFIIFVSNACLAGTRTSMAMSFDRILPAWLGQVSRRWHVPLNSILLFVALTFPAALLYALVDNAAQYTFSLYLLAIVGFGVSGLAATVLPFTRKRMYDESPAAKYSIAGVPLITIGGAMFVIYSLFSTIVLLTRDELGVNTSKGLWFVFGLWAFSLIVYVIAVLVRRSQKVDLSLSYKQLPVE
jgi:APA family basic amino acid/polyamine antiporter